MNTRPYFVEFNGKQRMVDATSQAAAIAHLAKPLVSVIMVASNRKVSEYVRAGGRIEVAGEDPEPAIPFKVGEPVEGDLTAVEGEITGDGTGAPLEPVE